VEALGDVLIYFHHPIDSTAELNVGVADTTLPLSFHDRRGSTRRPVSADVLEQSPMELSRLIAAYLPRDWSLVACNMGTAISTILTEDFKENDIIVIDDDSRRESYLHDELINTFGGRLVTQE
jgi:hypothetical protein